MSSILPEYKEKLQQLIYSAHLENVKQGLSLLSSIADDENDIYHVFDMYSTPNNFFEIGQMLSDFPNKSYVQLWFLGELAIRNTPWVRGITKLHLSIFSLYLDGRMY